MKKWFGFLGALLFSCTIAAQTTVVSGVATDSDGTLWTNGTVSVQFVPNSSQSNLNVYRINGAPLSSAVVTQGPISLGNSGSFSVTVYDNTQVTPSGSQWQFTVCPNAISKCGSVTTSVTGVSQNITTAVDAAIPAPRFLAVAGGYGYTDVESILSTPVGGTYWNVTDLCQRYYNGSTWNCGSGGGGVPTCSADQMAYYNSSGAIQACLDVGSGLSIADGTITATGGGGVQYPPIGTLHIAYGDSREIVGIGPNPQPTGFALNQDAGNIPMLLARKAATNQGQTPSTFTASACIDNGTTATVTGTGTLPVVNEVVEIEGFAAGNCAQLNTAVSNNVYNVSAVGSGTFSFLFTTTSFSSTAAAGTVTNLGMVVNLSIAGGTAAGANSNYTTDVHPLAASAGGKCDVTENNGGNDILSLTPPDQSVIKANSQALWTKIHADGCKVIRLTVLPATGYANCGGTGCYDREQDLNAWARTQTKDAVLAVNPTATAYIDYFIPYDLVCNNNADANCYYTSGLNIGHTTPAFNEQAAVLINDTLIDQTHRALANFDPTAPNAYLPRTNVRNTFSNQQEIDYNGFGDIGFFAYQNSPAYTPGGYGNRDEQPYMGVGQTHWTLNGSGQGSYGWAGFGFYNAGFGSTANKACLAITDAPSGICVDGLGQALYPFAAAASGHYCLQIDTNGLITNTSAACGAGGGTVTTSGSPVSPNIAAFSGSTSITAATSVNIQTAIGTDVYDASGAAAARQANLSLLPGTYIDGDMCIYTASGTLLNCNTAIPSIGTWGALNYPTWSSGTPFVKMTAAGTFALDTNTYLTSLPSTVVQTNQSNSFGAYLQDFSNAMQIKLPVASGYTSAANGEIGYDSAGNNWHGWLNGADMFLGLIPKTGISNNHCVQFSIAGGVVSLSDAGGTCTTGGSMVWPTTAGIVYWTSGTGWGGAYNASTPIPANYLPTDLSSSSSINGTSIPASATLCIVSSLCSGYQAALADPVTGPGSGVIVGHVAVFGNTSGTTVIDGGPVPTGEGTVNSGTEGQIAWYDATGTEVEGGGAGVINSLLQGGTGCNTAGYVYSPQSGTCAAPGGSSPLTTKGDLYGYSTTNTRIPVGTDGQFLSADSTQAVGVKWVSPSGTSAGTPTVTFLNGTAGTLSTGYTDFSGTITFTTGVTNPNSIFSLTFGGTYSTPLSCGAQVNEPFVSSAQRQIYATTNPASTNVNFVSYTTNPLTLNALDAGNKVSWWCIPTGVISGGGGGGAPALFGGLMSAIPTLAGTGLTTAYNQQGTFAASNVADGIKLVDTASQASNTIEGVLMAYPTPPFTLTILLTQPRPVANYGTAGIVVTSSTTGLALAFMDQYSNGYYSDTYTFSTPNTFGSNLASAAIDAYATSPYMWLTYVDDGTNITYSTSLDGDFPIQQYTVAKASSYLASSGFNYIGLVLDPAYSKTGTVVHSWSITYP